VTRIVPTLLLVSCLLSACGGGSDSTSSSPSPNPPSSPGINTATYFPLTVGNRWNYTSLSGFTNMTIDVLSPPSQFGCQSSVFLLSRLPGVAGNVFLARPGLNADLVIIGQFDAFPGGFFTTTNYMGIGTGKSFFMLLPSVVTNGQTFSATVRLLTVPNQDFSCLPNNPSAPTRDFDLRYSLENVNVPAFMGETIRVDLNDEFGFRGTWWFADGIGIVKFTFAATGIDNEFELQSFILR